MSSPQYSLKENGTLLNLSSIMNVMNSGIYRNSCKECTTRTEINRILCDGMYDLLSCDDVTIINVLRTKLACEQHCGDTSQPYFDSKAEDVTSSPTSRSDISENMTKALNVEPYNELGLNNFNDTITESRSVFEMDNDVELDCEKTVINAENSIMERYSDVEIDSMAQYTNYGIFSNKIEEMVERNVLENQSEIKNEHNQGKEEENDLHDVKDFLGCKNEPILENRKLQRIKGRLTRIYEGKRFSLSYSRSHLFCNRTRPSPKIWRDLCEFLVSKGKLVRVYARVGKWYEDIRNVDNV